MGKDPLLMSSYDGSEITDIQRDSRYFVGIANGGSEKAAASVLIKECVTTIPKGSRAKRPEAGGTRKGDDIVYSAWKHAAAINGGQRLATFAECIGLHNNLVFVKNLNREYSNEFAIQGAKIGATANVRLPNQYYVSTGANLAPQNSVETTTPVTITDQSHVDISFSTKDLTLSLDDFSRRILTPAMAVLAGYIDNQAMSRLILGSGTSATTGVYNQVGTPGTTPGTTGGNATGLFQYNAPQVFLNAGAMMDYMGAPRDENRRVGFAPIAQATSVAALSGLFQDSGEIARQYRKGVIGTALGFEFAMDQNIPLLSVGTHAGSASWVINGANQSGTNLTISGITANAANFINQGEVISIANITSVNPENQQSTGYAPMFVVTSSNNTANSGGYCTLTVSPSIVAAGANVANGTVSALPANGAAVSPLSGAANGTYPVNIAYHQDFATLATVDLEMPGGVDFAARETYDGISMRIVRAYDISTDFLPCRIDVLWGCAILRGQLACRIAG
jgi:hypothetical protein